MLIKYVPAVRIIIHSKRKFYMTGGFQNGNKSFEDGTT
jgi:hypothetical protein